MKLRDLGDAPMRTWFNMILEWSRKKITFDDNMDGIFVRSYIATTETKVSHTLGRMPRYVFEVAEYPSGTAGIEFTQHNTRDTLYLRRNVAGNCTLFIT